MKRTLNGVGYPILSGSATKNRFYQLLFDVFSDFGNGKLNFVSTGGVVETISRTPLLVSLGNVWILRRLIILWNINVKKNLILDPFLGRKGPIFGSKKLDFCRIFGSKSDQKEDEGRSFRVSQRYHFSSFGKLILRSFLVVFDLFFGVFLLQNGALLLQNWSSFASKKESQTRLKRHNLELFCSKILRSPNGQVGHPSRGPRMGPPKGGQLLKKNLSYNAS